MMDLSNKPVIVYDLASCPDGSMIEQIVHIYRSTGFLLYSSQNEVKGGRPPEIYNAGDIKPDIMVDTSTQESLNILDKLRKNG